MDNEAAPIDRPRATSAAATRAAVEALAGPLIAALAAALLLAAAFPPLSYSWLAWPALLPLAWLMCRRDAVPEIYFAALVGGIVFHAVALDWIRTSYGGSGLDGPRAAMWVLTAAAGGAFWLPAVAIGRMLVVRRGWPLVAALPVSWLAMEYLRKTLPALVDRTGFPWLQLGATLADSTHLAQVADLAGSWALTLLVASTAGAVGDVLFRGQRRMLLVPAALLVACLGYGAWRLNTYDPAEGPVVYLVPPDVQPWHVALPPTAARTADGGALLLWSEAAYDHTVFLEPPASDAQGPLSAQAAGHLPGNSGARWREAIDRLEECASRTGAAVLTGCLRLDAQSPRVVRYNAAVACTPEGGFVGHYDKARPVPWSEFTPSARIERWLGTGSQRLRQGAVHPVFALTGPWRCAPTICYDSAFPEVHQAWFEGHDPPDYFAVLSAEGADRSGALKDLMLGQSRLRAIETRRALVRNVEFGTSGIVDACGRVVQRFDGIEQAQSTEPIRLGPLPIDRRTSLYTRLGDWLPHLALVAAILGLVVRPHRPTRAAAWRGWYTFHV